MPTLALGLHSGDDAQHEEIKVPGRSIATFCSSQVIDRNGRVFDDDLDTSGTPSVQ